MTTFRVFVSSTFADFRHERDVLQHEVFPRLAELCRSHGASFEAVDLRWGIGPEAAETHDTLDICLREIERCQRLSPSPNFLVLSGDRYGWRPAPARVDAARFAAISSPLDQDTRALLEGAYRRDDNNVPAEYRLLPLPAGEARSEAETAIREALNRGAGLAGLDADQRLAYGASATHQEIVRGLLAQPDAEEHVVAALRSLRGIPGGDARAAAFQDRLAGGEVDPVAAAALSGLKDVIRRRLPQGVLEFEVQWVDGDVSTRHLADFAAYVERTLRRLVETQLAETQSENAALDQERAQHEAFGRARSRVFVARDADIARVLAALSSGAAARKDGLVQRMRQWFTRDAKRVARGAPLLIVGDGGVGKSAFLAALAERVRSQSPRTVVIERYVGASGASGHLPTLIAGICREIDARYGDRKPLPAGGEWLALAGAFGERLAAIRARRPLLLVIDALDQLGDSSGELGWSWLPIALPEGAHLLLSSREGGNLDVLTSSLPPAAVLRLPPLDLQGSKDVLRAWLSASGRSLQAAQLEALVPALEHSPLPLYVKLLYELVRDWPSWKPPSAVPETVVGLIDRFVDELALPARHGQALTHSALAHLSAARLGLGNTEMQAVLAQDGQVRREFSERARHAWTRDELPPILWTRLYFDLEAYLREFSDHGSVLYGFFHREFAERIAERLLASDAAGRHARIAHALEAACSDPYASVATADPAAYRVLLELPFQLSAADAPRAAALLCGLDMPMAKVRADLFADLLEDYSRVPHDRLSAEAAGNLAAMKAFLLANQHLVRRGSTEWPAERILLQLAAEQPPDTVARRAADAWLAKPPPGGSADSLWLRKTVLAAQSAHAAAAPIVVEYEERLGGVLWLKDGCLLICAGDRYRIVDADTGETRIALNYAEIHPAKSSERRSMPARDDAVPAELADGMLLLVASSRVQVWNPATGHRLATFANEDGVTSWHDLRDGRILLGLFRGLRIWEWRAGTSVDAGLGEEHVMGIVELPSARVRRFLTWGWSVRLWQLDGPGAGALRETGTLIAPHEFEKDGRKYTWYVPPRELKVSGDGTVVFRSTDGVAQAWDVSGESPAKLWSGEVGGSVDGISHAWDASGESPAKLWSGEVGEVSSVHPRGGNTLCLRDYADAHVLLDYAGKPVQRYARERRGHGSKVVSWDDERLIVVAREGAVWGWNRRGETLWVFTPDGGTVLDACALADGSTAVSSSKGVHVLDRVSGQVLFEHAAASSLGGIFLPTPDGRGVIKETGQGISIWREVARAGRTEAGTVGTSWWKLATLAPGCIMLQGNGVALLDTVRNVTLFSYRAVSHARATTDGVLLYAEGHLELRSVAGAVLAQADGHREPVVQSADLAGGSIAALSKDAVVLREAGTLRERARHEDAGLRGLLPLRDGRILLWREDRTVLAWNPSAGICPELGRHTGEVNGAVLVQGAVLSFGEDGVRSWSLDDGSARGHSNPFGSFSNEWGSVGGARGVVALPDGRILAWGIDGFQLYRSADLRAPVLLPGFSGADGAVLLPYSDELVLWDSKTIALLALDEELSHVRSIGYDEALKNDRRLYEATRGISWAAEPWRERWSIRGQQNEDPCVTLDRYDDGVLRGALRWHASEKMTVVGLVPDAVIVCDPFGNLSSLRLYRGGRATDFASI